MAMNSKRKGSRNERKTMRLLERQGYACTRAAASLGAWDVIGVSAEAVVLVQVKSNTWPRTKEMETLRAFACPPCCKRVIHRWRDGERLPDERLIESVLARMSTPIHAPEFFDDDWPLTPRFRRTP